MAKFTQEEIEYQTWLVKISLDNERANYDHIKELGESLIACDDYDFKVIIKNEFYYHDKIKWGAVDFEQLRQSVADCI
jgi:hypothetical protein